MSWNIVEIHRLQVIWLQWITIRQQYVHVFLSIRPKIKTPMLLLASCLLQTFSSSIAININIFFRYRYGCLLITWVVLRNCWYPHSKNPLQLHSSTMLQSPLKSWVHPWKLVQRLRSLLWSMKRRENVAIVKKRNLFLNWKHPVTVKAP